MLLPLVSLCDGAAVGGHVEAEAGDVIRAAALTQLDVVQMQPKTGIP